jgi:hypothetical protein
VITGAYVILGFLIYLAWSIALVVPLSEAYNQNDVLRLLILSSLSAVLCCLGLVGFFLSYRKAPVFDLALIHFFHPAIWLGVWGSDERYKLLPYLVYTVVYLGNFVLTANRVRALKVS